MQEEIIKHSKKIKKVMDNKNHSLIEKLKEIGIEIFIIVFAVSLSIWLHGKSEHNHQQEEVKDFLIDLKTDLKTDLEGYKISIKSTSENVKNYQFMANVNDIKIDSLKKNKANIEINSTISTTKINNGNYEGFKSSGKIGYIENKKLKILILQYYQEQVPGLVELEKYNTETFQRFLTVLDDNASKPILETIMMPIFKQKLKYHSQSSKMLLSIYQQSATNAKKIIAEIEKEEKL